MYLYSVYLIWMVNSLRYNVFAWLLFAVYRKWTTLYMRYTANGRPYAGEIYTINGQPFMVYHIWSYLRIRYTTNGLFSICGIPYMDDHMRDEFIPYIVDHLWYTIYGRFSVYGIPQMDICILFLYMRYTANG